MWKFHLNGFADWHFRAGPCWYIRSALLLILCVLLPLSNCIAKEKTYRLRLAWGSGTAAKQRWTGNIAVEGGVLSDLQPLGIEPDAAASVRIEGSRLVVSPLLPRGFDGCDVTVRADEEAVLTTTLQTEGADQPSILASPLNEVVTHQVQQPLDEQGSYFLARRSPGDTLRVLPTREHFVFSPGEKWDLKIQPDLEAELAAGPVVLEVVLRAVGRDKPLWQSSQQLTHVTQLTDAVKFEITSPPSEGAYRLTVTAKRLQSLATRFVPGQRGKVISNRDVEFVVIDPEAKLTPLVDQWLPVLTIDPANPSWWQRLPAWAQVPRLRDRSPGAIGNIRPVVRPTATGELLELPPSAHGGEPYWQSYTLPIREPGQPHLVEIEYPSGVPQSLDIALVEPNAAGKVTASEQSGSFHSDGLAESNEGETAVHRFVIWPKTSTPQLLIVNRSRKTSGQFGKIRLLRQDSAIASLIDLQDDQRSERLVVGYLSTPRFAEYFGSLESLDSESGLSVHSWATFLDGARRLARSLRYSGYNSVMLSVSADGSGLYPSKLLRPSPRYDTGLLATSGQDATKKDVLEMLLRVFDREGIRVLPALQLAAPMPNLETLRQAGHAHQSGIACVDYRGEPLWPQQLTEDGLAPYYNPLNQRVQTEILEIVNELTNRYASHSSFAGVSVQISGAGYGLMPGVASGFDDQTVADFAHTMSLPQLANANANFHQRSLQILSRHRDSWQRWRQDRLASLYHSIAEQVRAERADLRVILATDELFEGRELSQRVRGAIEDPQLFRQLLPEHAIDLDQIAAHPSIDVLVPHNLTTSDCIQQQATQLRVNAAAAHEELMASESNHAQLFFTQSNRFRLPSFDAQSPFGAEQTYLTVSSRPTAIGRTQNGLLVRTLSARDASLIVEGGQSLDVSGKTKTRSILQAIRQLPQFPAERQQIAQPVTLRVYRTEAATIVALINESPWTVGAEVELTPSQACQWERLGASQVQPNIQLSGNLELVSQPWQVQMQPCEVQAWRLADPRLRVGELRVDVDQLAMTELQRRIHEIESRAGNLDVQRPYPQLQNPSFELVGTDASITGWQPRLATLGTIDLDRASPRSGQYALHLKSEDTTGVAVESQLFPAPDTGQLTVSAYFRFGKVARDAQLQIAVQDESGGRDYHQYAVLGSEQLQSNTWTRFELPLTGVPADERLKLRLQLHLVGEAEMLVDDVELLDLRFDDARRRSLVTRIHGAKIALDQGQLVDCLRVVDDYWSRYLMEHVPPQDSIPSVAVKSTTTAESNPEVTEPEEENGFGSRVRGWVPKLWR